MSSSFEFRLENSNSAPHLSPSTLPKHTKNKNSLQMNFISLYFLTLSLFYCAFYSIFPPHPDAKKKFFTKISFAFIFKIKYTKLILHDEHSKHVDTLFLGSFRTIRHHFHSFFFFSSLLHFRVVVVVAFVVILSPKCLLFSSYSRLTFRIIIIFFLFL